MLLFAIMIPQNTMKTLLSSFAKNAWGGVKEDSRNKKLQIYPPFIYFHPPFPSPIPSGPTILLSPFSFLLPPISDSEKDQGCRRREVGGRR